MQEINSLKNTERSLNYLDEIKDKDFLFTCVIATTETSCIPGITGAGATPELTKYTPALDTELVVCGKPLSMSEIPQTVVEGSSTPTPAVITRAVVELLDIPFLVVDAGAEIKPKIPYIELNDKPGKDIRTGKAVDKPRSIYEKGKILGKFLSKITEYLIIGESTPAGTTTALGVLTALGYNASFKVSASLPENPHGLKRKVVMEGLKNANIEPGNIDDPFDAVKAVGDPMIPAVAGICAGFKNYITLAGGTQMPAVCALLKEVENFNFSKLAIATTVFVVKDESSDILNIVEQIGDIPVYYVDPHFEKSNHEGLKRYMEGHVKEGVGAGGAMFAAVLKGITTDELRKEIEKVCTVVF
ncbi:Nicotinate-nucleotide-dimethylbenzimidazolephosp horibosyltransferase [Methanothermus fervidus DSM 2088]|uniref:UPF0284 protein Mfer_1142 n=1 Tax=Methanothermus fervidus (strain ATCC 43054 / DSM 2088 / JCM 10308 / V24 S) TaxID=523846 RepID=E3GWG3_METFV|nr:TIGR00303 family protein [Methanothermus fervidus]ADP77928.1 Nicotinate-nucleotide-dimethylbenzimidazolephosp horibosyltransferase [Methanothermus fervidus DSM 2088]